MKKTALRLVLVLCLILTGITVFAAGEECPHCGAAVNWTAVKNGDWSAGGALETGHYRLSEDISLTAALVIPEGGQVCVDLCGFDLTQTAEGTGKSYTLRVFENSGTLTILDSAAKTENGEYISGVISGGSCYAGETNNKTHGANIYNDTGSVFNLYSGKISGGVIRRRYHSTYRFAGGNVFSRGTVNIYGGVIADGRVYSDYVAGVNTTGQRQIYVAGGNLAVEKGVLNIYGGEITGGIAENLTVAPSAPGLYEAFGGNVYVTDSTANIYGGLITEGRAVCNNTGADSASGTQVSARAYGGNFCYVGKGELLIRGGEMSGGAVTASAAAYEGKTLTDKNYYPFGGNFYSGEVASVRYEGGVSKNGTAYQGGCIFTDSITHISGGEFYNGKAVDTEGLTKNYGGVIFSSKKLYVYGGEFYGGQAKRGGNIFVSDYLTFAGGLIRDGVATDRGGNVGTLNGYLIVSGGEITGGSGSRYYGGNIWCANLLYIYGGKITDPVSGGNVTLMSGADCYMYGGEITGGGLYGFDSTGTAPGDLYIHGGKIDYIRTGLAGTNNIEIIGGQIGGFRNTSDGALTLEDLDANALGNPVVYPCTHVDRENGYTFFHHFDGYCDTCGHTFGEASCILCKQVHTNLTGSHSYREGLCTLCGYKEDGSQCAILGSVYYTDLKEALAEGEKTGKTVKLIRDQEIDDLSLYSLLDLNGHTLTVTGVLGAENKDAVLTDSVGTGGVVGKLVSHSENLQSPVAVDNTWRFEEIALKQLRETVDSDTLKLKFIIADQAADTLLDEATLTGEEYKVCIQVKWTEDGVEKVHNFRYEPQMVKEYASAWGQKMFTCTITGLSALENYTVTAQLVSGGVTVSAKDVTPPATTSVSRYDSGKGFTTPANMLTWEGINALPKKYPGMPVEEARQAVVAFMDYAKSFTWVSDADEAYFVSTSMGYHHLTRNSLYGGLPYVKVGTGNIYRFMDYMDPVTGVVDVESAMATPVLLGNQCSLGVYYAVSRVVNSNHTSAYTADLNYKNGYIPVGPYTYTLEQERFEETGYDTDEVCRENGEQVMYESYALVQPADGLVSPGHAILCTGLPQVVRREDGTIDPERSFLTISDQTNGWSTATNRFGERYEYTRNTRARWSFQYLYDIGYIPFTFGEFLGTDPIEETQVTYSHTGETITRDQLVGSTVTSNYGVSDIYAVFTDSQGNEVYKLAVRSRNSLCRELTFGFEVIVSKTNTAVQWGDIDALSPEETYTVEIIAQLTTGERPTLWKGRYVQ